VWHLGWQAGVKPTVLSESAGALDKGAVIVVKSPVDRHPGVSRGPSRQGRDGNYWIPAFAGMTGKGVFRLFTSPSKIIYAVIWANSAILGTVKDVQSESYLAANYFLDIPKKEFIIS
jgi:hypothetical protein